MSDGPAGTTGVDDPVETFASPTPDGPVVLDGESLTPAQVEAVAREDARVDVADEAREAVRRGRERVAGVVDADEPVYGINTGFGELVDTRIDGDDLDDLQLNLLRSHASGLGRELTREEVRALLVVQLNGLLTGHSGVREVVVDHLRTLLNAGVHPVVKSRGSLGASGDLAPLAHLSLVLVGEGQARVDGDLIGVDDDVPSVDDTVARNDASGDDAVARDVAGERDPAAGDPVDGETALAAAGLEPLSLAPKEGLALVNGTGLTAGLAALVVRDAERVLDAADAAGALTTEVTMGTTADCDPALHAVRPHAGQVTTAARIRALTADSEVVESHANCDRVQDPYSLRCLPQVHGAVRDAVDHLRSAVVVELNSATDNPLVFDADDVDPRATGTDEAAVLSGGNFHGEPLALRLDYAVGALTELAAIGERRVDRAVNPNLQEDHLPPFLSPESGLHSGLMIPQYTAAALLNELRSTGRPASDSTPVSGGQEDHVSMSATSAYAARRAVRWTRQVAAVELLTAAQAAEFVDDDLALGHGSAAAYDAVRRLVEPVGADRSLSADIEAVGELVADGLLSERLRETLS